MLAFIGSTAVTDAWSDDDLWARVAISEPEASMIRTWYAHQPRTLLATAQPAPAKVNDFGDLRAQPGSGSSGGRIARLERGVRLPVDVYHAGQELPPEILAKLPGQPRGTRLIRLDGKVVRVFRATRTVLDVLPL